MSAEPKWLELPLEGRTGADLFERLFVDEPVAVLLESPLIAERTARYSILAACSRRVLTPPLGSVLSTLEIWLSTEHRDPPPVLAALPFTGGLIGWFGYDLAWEIERLPWRKEDHLPFPVAYWFEPAVWVVADHRQDRLWLAVEDHPGIPGPEYWRSRLDLTTPEQPAPLGPVGTPWLLPGREGFLAMVEQVQDHIRLGDLFQTNLSLRFGLDWQGDGWQLYRRLGALNPSPFACYWRTPFGEVVSCSPERLVSLTGRTASTRPIAGTRPRGQDSTEDRAFESELLLSDKERAEHIMLVDLERNDLGRVCESGTVAVDELLAVERYSHVMHIVSNVVGRLRPGNSAVDLIRAVFPGGTITGCPKVRCMEIIEQIEPSRRSLFYGSCGYLDRRGQLDLNILIRTLLKSGDQVWGQVGAGIVADSDPEAEFQESLQKARAQWSALGLA